jgi:uncharacterized protein YyaL (SSP411 family)
LLAEYLRLREKEREEASSIGPGGAGEAATAGARRRGAEAARARRMLTWTLEKMARGGVYDHVGGGFHRYSVDEHWHVPHFEKMM